MTFNNHKEIHNVFLHNSRYKNELKNLESKKYNNYRDNYRKYQN